VTCRTPQSLGVTAGGPGRGHGARRAARAGGPGRAPGGRAGVGASESDTDASGRAALNSAATHETNLTLATFRLPLLYRTVAQARLRDLKLLHLAMARRRARALLNRDISLLSS
jgi:hypothetical protein